MGVEFVPEHVAVICGRIVSVRTPPEIPEFVDIRTVTLLNEF
jgi:hypothetical protein